MSFALLIDFGSTYTKLRSIDIAARRIVASGQGPSTVTTDVNIGLDAALADLERKLGTLPRFKYRLASSSAAGGLRMVTIGLVRELTAEAARQAALGAGARVIGTFAYRLTPRDVAAIEAMAPDIILLAGGTDGGNLEIIRHNATQLAASRLVCPIVLAGNRDVGEELEALITSSGKQTILAENVMPRFGELSIDSARAAIRQVFIDRIVHAKGIDRASSRFDAVLMPTPAAVMEGSRLLADGTNARPGLGEVMVVDIGGATTDVHSVATGAPSQEGVLQHGLPEPRIKRTVEGDLGMRHNADSIVEAAGIAEISAHAGVDGEDVGRFLDAVHANVEHLPVSPTEAAIDAALAWTAVRLSVKRHAGTIATVHSVQGPVLVQTGKDLTNVSAVIGTGGPLSHGVAPARVLEAALADAADPASLRPSRPEIYIDKGYILYAAGLLAATEPEAAFDMASSSLQRLQTVIENGDDRQTA